MSYAQALVLGLVQGLTEFLPVSSSGHLILVPRVFGWPDQGLAVDAALHLGTLAALLAYFRAEIIELISGALDRRLAVIIVLATIPGAVAGLLFGKYIEEHVRWPLLIAATRSTPRRRDTSPVTIPTSSRRKYTMSAANVPRCMTASTARPWSGHPKR